MSTIILDPVLSRFRGSLDELYGDRISRGGCLIGLKQTEEAVAVAERFLAEVRAIVTA